jgi:hypothetical protein
MNDRWIDLPRTTAASARTAQRSLRRINTIFHCVARTKHLCSCERNLLLSIVKTRVDVYSSTLTFVTLAFHNLPAIQLGKVLVTKYERN